MEENIQLQKKCVCNSKMALSVLVIIAVTSIVIVSILRDWIVDEYQREVTIVGQGKTVYSPDIAEVILGVQIDKAPTAESALRDLNSKMQKIIVAMEAIGIKKEEIQTQNYSLNPHYDYFEGKTKVSGYNANQRLLVKVKNIQENSDLLNNVISEFNKAGGNQVLSINFNISNLADLKQDTRLKAIADARAKSSILAKATGVKLGNIVGWYENVIQSPDIQNNLVGDMGGAEAYGLKSSLPQIPSGTQEIIIEMNLQYEVK